MTNIGFSFYDYYQIKRKIPYLILRVERITYRTNYRFPCNQLCEKISDKLMIIIHAHINYIYQFITIIVTIDFFFI